MEDGYRYYHFMMSVPGLGVLCACKTKLEIIHIFRVHEWFNEFKKIPYIEDYGLLSFL